MTTIVERFRAQKNPEIAAGQAAYLRHQFEFIGIKTPERRALQKEFLKQKSAEKRIDWDFVWAMWALPEREFQYLALDYLRKMKKFLLATDLAEIRKLAITKSWWETVDSLDELVGHLLLTDKTVSTLTTVKKWSQDENFWVRRIAIDCQLGFKEKTKVGLLAEVIENNLSGSSFADEFFINKAIGWALRDFSKTNPEWVSDFIIQNQQKLDRLSIREASKYLKN